LYGSLVPEKYQMDIGSNQNNPDFKVIAENSPDPLLVITGEKGNIVYCNPQVAAISGYTIDELLTHNISEFLHPQELVRFIQKYRLRLEGKIMADRYEVKILTRDGMIVPAEVRAQKITWQDQPADLITLRRLLEHSLTNEQLKLQARMLDSIGESVIATDPQGKITYASLSESARKLSGWNPSDIVGLNILQTVAPEFRQQGGEIVQKVLRRETWSGVLPLVTPNGKTFHSLTHLSPVIDDKGQVISIIGVSVEMKEFPQTKNTTSEPGDSNIKILAQLRMQAEILDTAGIGTLATDLSGNITYVSDSAIKLTGWKREELLGKSMFSRMPPEFLDKTQSIIEITSKGQLWSGEMPIQLSDGSFLHGWVYVYPICNDQRMVIGTVGVTIDIRDPRKTKEMLSGLIDNEKSRPAEQRQQNILDVLCHIRDRYLEDSRHFSQKRLELAPFKQAQTPGPDNQRQNFAKGNQDKVGIKIQAQMLDAVGLGALATDLQGFISYVSEGGLKTTGWKREELLGKNIIDIFPVNFHEQAREIINLTSNGRAWSGKMPMQRPDGSYLYGWVYVAPVFNEISEVTGIIGVTVDIRDPGQTSEILASLVEREKSRLSDSNQYGILDILKQVRNRYQDESSHFSISRPNFAPVNPAEKTFSDKALENTIAVRTDEQRQLEDKIHVQARMLDAMVDGIATDSNGIITYAGSTACKVTGWDKDDILGHSIFETFPAEFREKALDIMNKLLNKQEFSGLMPVLRKDRSIFQANIHIKPFLDENGEVIGTVSAFTTEPEQDQMITFETKPQLQNQVRMDTDKMLQEFQTRFEAAKQQLNKISEALSHGEHLFQQVHSAVRSSQGNATQNSQTKNSPAKPRLEIYCFGSLKVFSSTKQIQQWQSLRAKSVFEYLVNKRKSPVSKDVLMEALWPDFSVQTAANNLKTSIHDLRQTLSSLFDDPDFSCIQFSQGAYNFNSEIDLKIDAEEFERLWTLGKKLEKEGKIEEAIRELEKSEALYQGDYLEDELYQEWTISRRETLKDIFLLLLNKLADYSMSKSDYESCITYCHKILGKDNCREDTYRMLMTSYSRLGQKNNALRWYENCRQTMKNELNVNLAPETVDLYHRLLRGETI
jgi:PAS domain S-box-containing protein